MGIIIGNDSLRMLCIIFIDMCNGFLHGIHYLYRKDIVKIFCSPVLFCCRNCSRHQSLCRFICTDLHMLLLKASGQYRQKIILHLTVYKKGLACIAYTHTLGLCIDHNIRCHLKICSLVHIDMAVSGSGLDDRDRTLVYHCFDQSSSATWDQYIHIPVQLHKFRSRFSGGILDQLNSIFGNAAGF